MVLSTLWLSANGFKISCVAGYKKPIQKLIKIYKSQKGITIDALYGNMKQSIAHAKTGEIDLIIGDKNHLKESRLPISNYRHLGVGKVVVVFAKGVNVEAMPKSLNDPSISKIAMPQPKKAIYGVAGEEFLRNAKLYNSIKERLYIVATVPQVATYLITQEVEAGILNLTAYLANQDKFGTYFEVDSSLYHPIEIVVASLKCQDKPCQEFVSFLSSKEAQKVFREYGL